MSRIAKQIVYGALYLCVLGGIGAWIYFFYLKPAPTCFDHIQNQGEEGVDCGGPCAKVCTPATLQPITVLGAVMTFTTSPGRVTFLAGIANTNTDFTARNFDYRFDLSDASGTVVQSIAGQSFIYAGEEEYLVAPNEAVTSSVSNVALVIRNPVWAKSSDTGTAPQFDLENVQTGTISSDMIGTSGTLTNNDASAFDTVTVIALFKDASGAIIGASQTELDNVAPNGTYDFSVTYPADPNIDPAATEVHAYGLRP